MRRHRLRTRILGAVLAPVLAIGLLELGLRAFGFRHDPRAALLEGRPRDEVRETRVYAEDPDLLWTLRPSTVLDLPERGFHGARTNSLGLRGGEFPDRPAGPAVVCLGDSITFGLDLADEETWPARLGPALAVAGLPGAAVVNGGVPGWSSVQGMRLLERLPLEPDAVVFWFGMNDAKAARGAPDSSLMASASDLRRTLSTLRTWQLLSRLLTPAPPEPAPDARRASVEEFAAAVRHLSDRFGDRAVFVRTPTRLDRTVDEFRMMVADAERAGAKLIRGPKSLLLPWIPAAEGADLTARSGTVDGLPAVVYDEGAADATAKIETVRDELGLLFRLRAELQSRLATLPPGALSADDLFGGAPEASVFNDNCHLSARGADLAARAVAVRIAAALRK